jgi:hypothetical protein
MRLSRELPAYDGQSFPPRFAIPTGTSTTFQTVVMNDASRDMDLDLTYLARSSPL